MTSKKEIESILNSIKALGNDAKNYLRNKKIPELSKSLQTVGDLAKNDLKTLVKEDWPIIRKRFENEKKKLEGSIEKLAKEEVSRAKKFVEKQKKELGKLQKKFNACTPTTEKKRTCKTKVQ